MTSEGQIKAPAIPLDVWKVAEHVAVQTYRNSEDIDETKMAVAVVILAERERCAAVAERYGKFEIDTEHGEGYVTAASNIAAAIRAGV